MERQVASIAHAGGSIDHALLMPICLVDPA